MPGFLMDTQRGAGRLYSNPTLAGYPAGDRGFILAGNGQRAIAGHACTAGVGRFYPHQSDPPRHHIITHRKRLSPGAASAARLSPSARFWPVLPLTSPAYEAGKTAARKWCNGLRGRCASTRTLSDGTFYYLPGLGRRYSSKQHTD